MLDSLNITHQTPSLVFLNILIVVLIYQTLKKTLKRPYLISRRKYYVGVALCLIFCLFSFWGMDWFHYSESFISIKAGYPTSLEEVYVWIIQNLCSNYIIFRFIIWGAALFLFLKISKNIRVSRGLALLFLGCIYIIWFSYARATLAMAFAFCGYALIIKDKRKLQDLVVGLLLLISSYFFHKTSVFAIATVFTSLIIKKYPRYAILILIIILPLIIIYAKIGISSFMILDVDGDSDMASYMLTGKGYMGGVTIKTQGIGALFMNILERVPYYLIAFLSSCMILKKEIHIPADIKAFMILQIIIVYASSVFAFDLGANTSTIYGRFLRFAAIPTAFVMAYLYQSGYKSRLTIFTIRMAVCGTLYAMMYSLYNSAL